MRHPGEASKAQRARALKALMGGTLRTCNAGVHSGTTAHDHFNTKTSISNECAKEKKKTSHSPRRNVQCASNRGRHSKRYQQQAALFSTISLATRLIQIRSFMGVWDREKNQVQMWVLSGCKSHAHRATECWCLAAEAEKNTRKQHEKIQIDRHAAGHRTILVRHCNIAHVREILWPRQHERCKG